MIIQPLPSWAILSKFPAFYETESVTTIEQTARVYSKMNELIESYNKYIEQVNGELVDLEKQTDKDLNCAIQTIINLTDSYISAVDLKMSNMSRTLDEHYLTFTDNVLKTIKTMVQEMKEAGELDEITLNALSNLNNRFTNIENGFELVKSQFTDFENNVKEWVLPMQESVSMLGDKVLSHGLGGAPLVSWGAVDGITEPGWYRFHEENGITIDNITYNYAYMRVDAYNVDNVTQTLYPLASGSWQRFIVRSKQNGSWYRWLWMNPPLIVGGVYPTIETYEGKIVYTCRYSATIPENSAKQKHIFGSEIPNAKIIRIQGVYDGNVSPYVCYANDGGIKIQGICAYNTDSGANVRIFDTETPLVTGTKVEYQVWYVDSW